MGAAISEPTKLNLGNIMPRITMTLEKQRNTNWCWAAVGLAVLNHYRGDRHEFPASQQALADKYVGGENKEYDIYEVLKANDISNGTDTTFKVTSVKASIDQSEPVVLQTGPRGNAHFVLIVGYGNPTGMGVDYEILDPRDPTNPTFKKKEDLGSILGLQYTKKPSTPSVG